MKKIGINGANYAFSAHQQDERLPDLLMLHGFMGDRRVFAPLIPALCTFCNPVTLDLLGHGETSKPAEPARYHEKRQVEDLRQLIQKLEYNPLFLFGYSMGGRLALKTALAGPEKIRGLILESTTSGITNVHAREKRRKTDRERACRITSGYGEFLKEWEKAGLFQSPRPVNPKQLEKYHRVHRDQDPTAMAASLQGFGTGKMKPATEWDRANFPVLLLAGTGDVKYQRINRSLAKKFPKAEFTTVKAGHRTHLDNPEVFLERLKKFFDNVG